MNDADTIGAPWPFRIIRRAEIDELSPTQLGELQSVMRAAINAGWRERALHAEELLRAGNGVAETVTPRKGPSQDLTDSQLLRIQEPCALFLRKRPKKTGPASFVYTVGGVLDGRRLARGWTAGGNYIVVEGAGREAADALANAALMQTIQGLRSPNPT